jgi:hypothetical protein
MINIENLKKELYKQFKKKKKKIIYYINTEIAYMFFYNQKYYCQDSHEYDQIIVVDKDGFDLYDYEYVSDFLKELNGEYETSPEYGFIAKTLADDIDVHVSKICMDLLRDTINSIEKNDPVYSSYLKKELNKSLFREEDNLFELVYISNIIGDDVFLIIPSIIKSLIYKQYFPILIENYRIPSEEKRIDYLIKEQEKEEKEETERKYTETAWGKIKKLYRIVWHENLPEYIIEDGICQKLIFLFQSFDEIAEDKIRMVGKYFNDRFLDSVSNTLRNFVKNNIVEQFVNNFDCFCLKTDNDTETVLNNIKKGKWNIKMKCMRRDLMIIIEELDFEYQNEKTETAVKHENFLIDISELKNFVGKYIEQSVIVKQILSNPMEDTRFFVYTDINSYNQIISIQFVKATAIQCEL